MANDGASTIDLAWRRVIVGLRIDEIASDHVVNRHLDRKRLAGRNSAAIGRERKFR